MSRPTVAECVRLLESEATGKEWDACQSERRGFLAAAEATRKDAAAIRYAVRLLIIHALPEEGEGR